MPRGLVTQDGDVPSSKTKRSGNKRGRKMMKLASRKFSSMQVKLMGKLLQRHKRLTTAAVAAEPDSFRNEKESHQPNEGDKKGENHVLQGDKTILQNEKNIEGDEDLRYTEESALFEKRQPTKHTKKVCTKSTYTETRKTISKEHLSPPDDDTSFPTVVLTRPPDVAISALHDTEDNRMPPKDSSPLVEISDIGEEPNHTQQSLLVSDNFFDDVKEENDVTVEVKVDTVGMKESNIAKHGKRRSNCKIPETRIIDGFAVFTVASSFYSMTVGTSPVLGVASTLCMCLALYAAYQTRLLREMDELRKKQITMTNESDALQTSNTKLRMKSVGLQASVTRLKGTKRILKSFSERSLTSDESLNGNIGRSSSRQSFQKHRHSVKRLSSSSTADVENIIAKSRELKSNCSKIKKQLQGEILQTIFKAIFASNRGNDIIVLNRLGMEIIVARMRSMPNIIFHEDRFRRKWKVGSPPKDVMRLCRDMVLDENSLEAEERIFTFMEKTIQRIGAHCSNN